VARRGDDLVSDATIMRELDNLSRMALWRWSRDPALKFPRLIKIRNRNYRSRREFEAFKKRMFARAGGGGA